MKRILVLLLCIGSTFGLSAQAPVMHASPQVFLKWIQVRDSMRAQIIFIGTNDTAATQAYVRAHSGAGGALIQGFGIKVSADTINVDSANYRKVDSLYPTSDTTFAVKLNGRLYSYKMRGGVFSFANRYGYVQPQDNDYAAFYPKLDSSYSDPSFLNSLSWSKMIGLPNTLAGYNILDAVKNSGGAYSLGSGVYSAKPTSGFSPAFYYATDSAAFFYYNGSTWTKILSSGGTGNITGTLTPGSIPYAQTGSSLGSSPIINDTANTRIKINVPLLINSTGASILDKGTTAQRPGSPVAGDIRFNTDSAGYEQYTGSAWSKFGPGTPGTSGTVTAITPGFGLTPSTVITSSGGFGVDTTVIPQWRDTLLARALVTKTYLTGRGYLAAETDPVATAKTVTLTGVTNGGVKVNGTGSQNVGGNPLWSVQADTAIMATKATAQQKADSLGHVIAGKGDTTGGIIRRSDTTNKWVSLIKRSGDSVYYQKNGSWIFAYLDSTGGSGITYPNAINKYLNGYGNFPTLSTDSIAQGSTNKYFVAADTANLSHRVDTIATKTFNIYVQRLGQPGDTALSAHDSIINIAAQRDSLDFHHNVLPDKSWINYVQAHDTSTANALQSKYRSDTSRANIYATRLGRADSSGAGAFKTLADFNRIRDSLNAVLAGKMSNFGNSTGFQEGLYAGLPAASGNSGLYYVAIDSAAILWSNGTAWTVIARANGGSSVTLANPTGTIGYAPVNGVAVTAMRSDGAPAADTTATTGLAPRHIVGDTAAAIRFAQRWPAPAPLGLIYKKIGFKNGINDFQANAATMPVTNVSGNINLTPSTISWGNTAYVNPVRLTMINRWKFKTTVKMTTTPTSGSLGFGPSMLTVQSANVPNGIQCYINTTAAGAGGLNMVTEGGSTTLATHTGHQIHLNDSLDLILQLRDTTIVFICQNWTTGFTDSANYAFVIGVRTMPTTCVFGYTGHGDGTGTYQIQAVEITSDYLRNANIGFLGSSKWQGYKPDFWYGRLIDSMNRKYPNCINYSEGNGRYVDVRNRIEEVMALNPAMWVLADPCNDLRGGFHTLAQVQADYIYVHDMLAAGGRPIINLVLPEDTTLGGVSLTVWNAWVKAKWPLEYVNSYDTMSTANVLKPAYDFDGVHPNQAGNYAEVRALVASGKLSQMNPDRLVDIRVGDVSTARNGDSLSALPMDRKPFYVNHPTYGGWSNGVLQDNGTAAGVSANAAFIQMPASVFSVSGGALGIAGGTGNGIIFGDLAAPTDATYNMFGSNRMWGVYSLHGTATVISVDSIGRLNIGKDVASSLPSAWLHINRTGVAVGHAAINFQIAGSAWTSAPVKGNVDVDSIGNIGITDSTGTRDTLAKIIRVKKLITDSIAGLVSRLSVTPFSTLQKYATNLGSTYDARTFVDKNYDDSARAAAIAAAITGAVYRIAPLDSLAKNAKGLQVSGSSLVPQSADGSFPGLITTAAQNIAGIKTLLADLLLSHIVGVRGTGTLTAGAGAGTSPSVSIVGNDIAGDITVTTGTLPTAGAVVVTSNYFTSFPSNSFPLIYPGNSATALLSGATMVFSAGTTTAMTINAGTTALAPATTYVWHYVVIGN